MSRPYQKVWYRMLLLLVCVLMLTMFVRGILPEFFSVHGTPEQECSQWQPVNTLTPTENILTLAFGAGLAITVVRPCHTMLEQLQWSLQALAQPGEVQLRLLPDFVCKADELALDFDHWWGYFRGNHPKMFTGEQTRLLNGIDTFLDEMSGQDNYLFWTDDALRSSQKWVVVGEMANQALATLGWPTAAPPVSRPERE